MYRTPLCGTLLVLLTLLGTSFILADESPSHDGPHEPGRNDVEEQDAAAAVSSQQEDLAKTIDQSIRTAHVGPLAELTRDEEFLRRVYLDLVGRIPSVDELQAFLAQPELDGSSRSEPAAANQSPSDPAHDAQQRRYAVVDHLLASDEFNDHFAIVLDVMLNERRRNSHVAEEAWRGFLRDAIARHVPLNQLVETILAADGIDHDQRAAAGFYLAREMEPHAVTRDVSRVFWGRDLQCAQCHDHPLVDAYRQNEYYGIYAFLHRSAMAEQIVDPDKPGEKIQVISEKAEGEAEYRSVFVPGETMSTAHPSLVGGFAVDLEPRFGEPYVVQGTNGVAAVPRFSRRIQLARAAGRSDNRHVARNFANRLWAHLLGTGLVSPVDMHHRDNPATHPELLEQLTDGLMESGFDVRFLLGAIAKSTTYQRAIDMPVYDPTCDETGDRCEKLAAAEVMQRDRLAEVAEAREEAEQAVAKALARLRAAETDVAQVDAEITRLRKELATIETKESEQQKKLKEAQSLEKKLLDAVDAIRTASDAIGDDAKVASAAKLLVKRHKATQEEVAAAQEELERHAASQKAFDQQLRQQLREVARVDARRVDLALRVAEERGVARRAQQRFNLEAARATDLSLRLQSARQAQQRAEVVHAGADSDDSETDFAVADTTDSDVVLQNGDGVEDVWSRVQREANQAWSRHFAVRDLKPLTPEQLAFSTVQALSLTERFENEERSKWRQEREAKLAAEKEAAAKEAAEQGETAKEGADRGKAAAEDGQEKTAESSLSREELVVGEPTEDDLREIDKKVAGRLAQVVSSFVSLYAAPGGAPQDGFNATVDQALFVANGGAMKGWLAPAEGTLMNRMNALDDQMAARELYQAVLSRAPDATESAAVVAMLGDGERPAVVEQLIWGLLASVEFRFNH